MNSATNSRTVRSVLWFALAFAALALAHAPLLKLPYYWDEAGYYIPAARDLYLTGSLIPTSGPSNAHPPLVMAYLSLIWKITGYRIIATRLAMVALATFALAGLFQLAKKIANAEVALATVICTAVYPVFFAQSSMAHVDLAAAGFIFWGLWAHFDDRPWLSALWFCLAALAKETAILIPVALLGWQFFGRFMRSHSSAIAKKRPFSFAQLLPVLILSLWYGFHFLKTGFVFGNPEFFRYNVADTMQPLRIVLAFGLRLWQLLGYMNVGLLTAAALLALLFPPQKNNGQARPPLDPSTQFELYAIIAVYTLAMSFIGGAVLARYMLPVVPLIFILCISTLFRRLRVWLAIVAVVVAAFAAALFINPSYGFSFEDNLAYRDYIQLHQSAEHFIETRYPQKRVLTAWPASDELTHPYLGYVSQPVPVLRIEDFTLEQLMSAAELRSNFDVALVFSTKNEVRQNWFQRWPKWREWKTRFFGYHEDLPPPLAAQLLAGHIVFSEKRRGQWIAVIEMPDIREAEAVVRPTLVYSPLSF